VFYVVTSELITVDGAWIVGRVLRADENEVEILTDYCILKISKALGIIGIAFDAAPCYTVPW